jgi:hypothetical protein
MNWLIELRQVEAWIQREVQAEQRLEALLRGHQLDLGQGRPTTIAAGAEQLAQAALERDQRLSELRGLFERIGQQVGVRAGTLSLGSLAERAGEHGQRLGRLRGDLIKAHEGCRRALVEALAIGRTQGQVLKGLLIQLIGVDPLSEPERLPGRFVEVRA